MWARPKAVRDAVADLVVGTVASPQPWRRALHAHVRDHATGIRLLVLHDADDAVRDAVDVLVVDDSLDFLTQAQVAALQERGVWVVGVFDPTGRSGRGRQALARLGVDASIAAPADPALLVAELAMRSPARRVHAEFDDVVAGLELDTASRRPREHQVIVVAGGSGSPGRTEVAAAIAYSLGRRGEPTLLVDLDDRDPTVARRLGFELVPNVLDAVAARRAGQLVPDVLARRARFADGSFPFDAIVGLAQPGDRAQLADVDGLLDELAGQWHRVVIDIAATDDDEGDGPRRQTPARAVLQAADTVVVVCAATPLGVLRLLDWAPTAAEATPASPVTLAMNRSPRERFMRLELTAQVEANLPDGFLGDVAFLPEDRRVTEAVWAAGPVARGPFTKAVDRLCDAAAPPAPPALPTRGIAPLGGRWRRG